MYIIPNPKKYTLFDEWFDFSDKLIITLPVGTVPAEYIPVYTELISNYTAGMTKAEFVLSDKLCGAAVISKEPFCDTLCEKTDDEYELHVKPDGAKLVFSEKTGFIHALTSFIQLIRIDEGYCYARATDVWDSPKINFRAAHLCVFRETTLGFLKKSIAMCGMAKYSHIVLEFWGMYRYKCCPGLSWRDAYTDAQIKPLVLFANALGIEVIPMLNHMGHASQGRVAIGKHSALDTDLSLAPLFEDDGWSWCTSNPKTQKLLAQCRRELCELCGEGKYFHIGFDEAYTFATCRRCMKYDRLTLMKEQIINTNNDIRSLCRRTIMWADMMHDKSTYDMKVYTCLTGSGEYVIKKDLPRDIIMAEWQYDCTEIFKTALSLNEDGFDTVTCPWEKYGNIDAATETVAQNGLFGVIETTWHTLGRNIDRLSYAGEKMWSIEGTGGHAVHHLISAFHMRRCVPSNGNYAEAGINEHELPSLY